MADDRHKRGGEQGVLEQRSFLLALVLVTSLFLYLLKPFFGAVFWACVIGMIFYPLQQRFLKLWGNRPTLAALTTLTICVIIGIIPVFFVLGSFLQEGVDLYQRLENGDIDPEKYVGHLRDTFPAAQQFLDRFDIDLHKFKEQIYTAAIAVSRYLAQNAVKLGQGTLQFFVSLGLMLYLAFFMLRDGLELVALLVCALPLGDERERLLFAKFGEVTRATVKGNLAVAALQGLLGGIIFWSLSIPGALFWGVVMVLLSLVPVVGAGLIWGPVAVYLFAIGNWVQGLILVGFGVGVIGLVDNILRPILVGRDTKLPDYIVLFSTLGGLVLFGMNGFVLGPMIAALFVAFWGIFMREFNAPPPDAPATKRHG
jgi:predicted PurR-regulated permease PerM